MTRISLISVLLVISGLTVSSVSSTSGSSFVSNSFVDVASTEPVRSKLSRANFEDSVSTLYTSIGLDKLGMNYDVFRYGMIGFYTLKQDGKISDRNLVSFIDFTKPSTEKRFYTVDLDSRTVKFHSLVSHGRNTGENMATAFSNKQHSNQSSLGFYITGETYVGSKGYSMRLDGADGIYNSNMRNRAVVMHDADYVSENWIKKYGRLGRSQGCPALPKGISRQVIDTIKDKTVIFAYYNDAQYLKSSAHLNLDNLFLKLDGLQAGLN
jgi:hypothetical protein